MKKKDYITLGLTFLVGIFAGFYMYVTSFAPQYAQDDVPQRSEITITGDKYGGCMMGGDNCSAFYITDAGAYQYTESKDAAKERGTLPKEILDDVLELLQKELLAQHAQPVAVRDCVSYTDGIDYRYIISIRGTSYTLDTCTTEFPYNSSLHSAFMEVWRYVENPTVTYPVIIEEGLGGFLIDRLQHSTD